MRSYSSSFYQAQPQPFCARQRSIYTPCLDRSDKDEQDGIDQFVSCESSTGVVQNVEGRFEAGIKRFIK